MTTVNDLRQAQAERAAWSFDPDQVQVETPTNSVTKSAAALVAQIQDHRQAVAAERDEVVDRLQAKRRKRDAERARIKGLSTAEILAALGVPARRRAG